MKKLFTVFCFLLLGSSAFAQYQTPGTSVKWTLTQLVANSAGAVTLNGGEYFINDSITIAQNDTLEILTNETIKLDNKIMVTIAGTLIINPTDSVKITAINPVNKFHSLRFEEFSDASVLRKTIIEHGSGIRILNSDMLIDSCDIRFHNRAYNSGAISVSNAVPVIKNSKIHHNFRCAIIVAANGNASPQIINNNIYFNGTENAGSWPQINLGSTNPASPVVIQDNVITGNRTNTTSGGISISNLIATSPVTNVLIERNIVTDNRFGAAFLGNRIQATIRYNEFFNNNTNPDPNTGGSGLNFNGDTTNRAIVSSNQISGNLWGVTIQNAAKPSFGLAGSSTDWGGNSIHGNGNGGLVYDLYNNTADSIYAQNNYWGMISAAQIETHIFHKTDDPNLGFVNYNPYLLLLGKPEEDTNSAASVYPNPAQHEVNFKLAENQRENTSILIYDGLGRKVANLKADKTNLSGGNAAVNFRTDALANGMYMFKIISGHQISTGKFIIRK